MTYERIDEATAKARLEETDRARNRYVERVYGTDPADPARYHLLLDSTAVGTDACVDIVEVAAKAFWGTPL